jgi:hypothetical protein
MRFLRGVAWLYAAVVACTFVFALAVDVAMRNSAQEHMLPNFILAFVCAPLDLAVFLGADLFFSDAFSALGIGQLVVIAACGAAQAWLLLWLTRPAI